MVPITQSRFAFYSPSGPGTKMKFSEGTIGKKSGLGLVKKNQNRRDNINILFMHSQQKLCWQENKGEISPDMLKGNLASYS